MHILSFQNTKAALSNFSRSPSSQTLTSASSGLQGDGRSDLRKNRLCGKELLVCNRNLSGLLQVTVQSFKILLSNNRAPLLAAAAG